MSIPNSRPLQRQPIHPGEILREEFLPDYGLSVKELATAIGVSRQSVNELLRQRRSLSPLMALKLGQLFGNGAEFWLNLQRSVDLYEAQLVAAPVAVAMALPRSADAISERVTSASMAALAAQVMRDPRASKIQKRLAASVQQPRDASNQGSEEAERTAVMVLRGKRYAGVTRELAASLMARSVKERDRKNG